MKIRNAACPLCGCLCLIGWDSKMKRYVCCPKCETHTPLSVVEDVLKKLLAEHGPTAA